MDDKSTKFIENLNDLSKDLVTRYITKQINFVLTDDNKNNIYSIGFIETVIEDDENYNEGKIILAILELISILIFI